MNVIHTRANFTASNQLQARMIEQGLQKYKNPLNSVILVLFFRRQKQRFARMTLFFDNDNDGSNDNYDDNYGNFDDNYDKHD